MVKTDAVQNCELSPIWVWYRICATKLKSTFLLCTIYYVVHTRIFFCTRDLRQGVVCLDKLVQYIIGQKYLFE